MHTLSFSCFCLSSVLSLSLAASLSNVGATLAACTALDDTSAVYECVEGEFPSDTDACELLNRFPTFLSISVDIRIYETHKVKIKY